MISHDRFFFYFFAHLHFFVRNESKNERMNSKRNKVLDVGKAIEKIVPIRKRINEKPKRRKVLDAGKLKAAGNVLHSKRRGFEMVLRCNVFTQGMSVNNSKLFKHSFVAKPRNYFAVNSCPIHFNTNLITCPNLA